MKNQTKQRGQGMTEYIIIVALIAIAAIAVYGFFGDTVRGQVGVMSKELAGESSDEAKAATKERAQKAADASKHKDLSNYTEKE